MRRFAFFLLFLLSFSACNKDSTTVLETDEPEPTPDVETLLPPEESNPSNQVADAYKTICEQGVEQNGPWNNDLVLHEMDADKELLSQGETLVEGGGVPSMIQDAEGRLIMAFQWFSCDSEEGFDKVAIMTSEDQGASWSDPVKAIFEGFPTDLQRPFDPTLALLEDGRIRMYYTSSAWGKNQIMTEGYTDYYSAISEDGIHYTFEEGTRFNLEEANLYDSAVTHWNGLWHMTAPKNSGNEKGAYHATSEDGLNFEEKDEITALNKKEKDLNWTGNLNVEGDAMVFYGTPLNGKTWWTQTTDGKTWTAPQSIDVQGGDPTVVCVEEDTCVMVSVKAGPMPAPTK